MDTIYGHDMVLFPLTLKEVLQEGRHPGRRSALYMPELFLQVHEGALRIEKQFHICRSIWRHRDNSAKLGLQTCYGRTLLK